MGCSASRSESKVLRILDEVIHAIACDEGVSEAQFEKKILNALQRVREECKKHSRLHPRVQHQFVYAMGMLRQRRPGMTQRLKAPISDTMNVVIHKTLPGAASHTEKDCVGLFDTPSSSPQNPTQRKHLLPPPSPTPSAAMQEAIQLTMVPLDGKVDGFEQRNSCTSTSTSSESTKSPYRLKSFHASQSNQSLETLGDFGFFDDMQAT